MGIAGVTDVISRPKAWSLLSWKGREPYVKMLNFLQDKAAVERLKEVEQRKIRQSKMPDTVTPTFKIKDESSFIRKGSPDYEPEIGMKRKIQSHVDASDLPKKCPVIYCLSKNNSINLSASNVRSLRINKKKDYFMVI